MALFVGLFVWIGSGSFFLGLAAALVFAAAFPD